MSTLGGQLSFMRRVLRVRNVEVSNQRIFNVSGSLQAISFVQRTWLLSIKLKPAQSDLAIMKRPEIALEKLFASFILLVSRLAVVSVEL
jgi:hypothetical protein